MIFWNYSVRETLKRPGRALLTLFGIGLGLAAIVATQLTLNTIHHAYRDLRSFDQGRSSLEITGVNQIGFDGALVSELRSIPGVAEVVPRICGTVAVVGKSGSIPITLMGISGISQSTLIGDSLPMGGARGIERLCLLDENLSGLLAVSLGQTVRVWAPTGQVEVVYHGLLPSRLRGKRLGGLMIVPFELAQDLFGLKNQINSVELVLAEGADENEIRAKIESQLSEGLVVQNSQSRSEFARNSLKGSQQGLSLLGVVAIIAASFVIINTFLLNLGERRHQFAVLRVLGATASQIMQLILFEAFFYGFFGALLGSVAGWGVSNLLLGVISQFLSLPLPGIEVSLQPFALALVLGPILAMGAAWIPARQAVKRKPIDELYPERMSSGFSFEIGCSLLGGLCLVFGIGLKWAENGGWISHSLSNVVSIPTLIAMMVGMALTIPLILNPTFRLVRRLVWGLEGSIALEQLIRHRTRTGLTAIVLFFALSISIAFAHTTQGIFLDLKQWCQKSIVADYLVLGSPPDTAFSLVTAMPESLEREVAQCADVSLVDKISFLPVEINGVPVLMLARTFQSKHSLPLDLQEGESETLHGFMAQGEVVLGTHLARDWKLGVGDSITLKSHLGPRSLRIAGTATEYAGGGKAIYLEWEIARALTGLPGVHGFLVTAQPGRVKELGKSLGDFCEKNHLQLQKTSDLHLMIEGHLARISGLMWVLMSIAFFIASFGLVNTLTMNIADEKRELGILRILGFQRGQIHTMVLFQSGILVGAVILPGVVAGMVLTYLISVSQGLEIPSAPAFHPNVLFLAGPCFLAFAVSLGASFFPAWHIARLPVVMAIRKA